MPDRPLKSTRLSVSLEEQDHNALAEIAAENDVSISWVIRKAIRKFVEKYRDGIKERDE
jgi:predicted transcriptional regulator